jgi:cell wall-associated NlpC family hydrolase
MHIIRTGKTLLVDAPAGPESHQFRTVAEAKARAAFMAEALSWIGTPFVNCGDVKGPRGAVDCAMLLTRCAVDTGLIAPFDPRPYEPQWHIHHDQELFVEFITDRLGGIETATPRPGDIAVWKFNRTFSHGGVILSANDVVHAWSGYRMVMQTRRDEAWLTHMPVFGNSAPRPVRYFDLWSAAK